MEKNTILLNKSTFVLESYSNEWFVEAVMNIDCLKKCYKTYHKRTNKNSSRYETSENGRFRLLNYDIIGTYSENLILIAYNGKRKI